MGTDPDGNGHWRGGRYMSISSSEPAILVKRLTKKYGDSTVVDQCRSISGTTRCSHC